MLCFPETIFDRLLGVRRERLFPDNVCMQVVSKELSAGRTAVTIIDSEKAAFGPLLVLSVLRLYDVQNNADSVFVVGSHQPLVCIRCVGSDNSISLERALGGLMVGNHYSETWLQLLWLFLCRGVLVHHLVDIQNS